MSNNFNIDEIRQVLNKITDPDLNVSLLELNAIKDLRLDGNLIKIEIELVQPIQWTAQKIYDACMQSVRDIEPSFEVSISINEIPEELPKRDFLKGVKNIIAVASGKGGVGKSAVASNIASALSLTGAKVGILDGDVYGPSQPTMFNLKDAQIFAVDTPEGKTVAYPSENYGIKVASMGFIMQRDEAAIVRGPMLAGYFSMLFEQIEWGNLDFLIFDLPPGTGDIQLTLTQKIPLTGAVIVTTPQEIAVADVRRSISMFKRVNVDILGVVENMSYFVPEDMPDKKYYIFGQGGGKMVAEDQKVGFLGEVPLSIKLRENNDGGKPLVLADEDCYQSEIIKEITSKIVSEIRKLNYIKMGSSDLEISL